MVDSDTIRKRSARLLIAALFLLLPFILSACTNSSHNSTSSPKPYFRFSNKNGTVKEGVNFTGWWKLYYKGEIPKSAVIEVFTRKNAAERAVGGVIIPAYYHAKGKNYTFASKINAFYVDNKSFKCCRPSFNESGTYYVDEYLYNCSKLNDYFMNACDSLEQYKENILAANIPSIHARMQINVN